MLCYLVWLFFLLDQNCTFFIPSPITGRCNRSVNNILWIVHNAHLQKEKYMWCPYLKHKNLQTNKKILFSGNNQHKVCLFSIKVAHSYLFVSLENITIHLFSSGSFFRYIKLNPVIFLCCFSWKWGQSRNRPLCS